MVVTQPLITEFELVGKLEDIITNSKDCLKCLQVSTEKGKYLIEVTKDLRNRLSEFREQLKPGCSLKVKGERKYQLKKGRVKYKGYRIKLLERANSNDFALDKENSQEVKPKAKVLFCKKSTCWKKGGKAACEKLKAELKSRGLANEVEIKTTGCLKQCGKAPNMVMMPDKARYSKVKSKQVVKLIDKHLLA